ncbi:hypothetical protein ACJVC5_06495 [Peredibacter sp. HCB2-198]|uniref:hypothetical protein n=1 Tax=Peredibacter sp. HCB2-198 TaxID=3383025 RepID=UPI0038B41B34
MACSGAHCNYHNTGVAHCGGGHRQPGNPVTDAAVYPPAGQIIRQSYIDDLRNKIQAELNRWRQHPYYASVNPLPALNPGTIPYGSRITNDSVQQLYQKINEADNVGPVGHPLQYPPSSAPQFIPGPADDIIPGWSESLGLTDGSYIRAADLVPLVDAYNAIRMDCICHADCYENNVCACHNNCDCHYSDKRLKKEIQYC